MLGKSTVVLVTWLIGSALAVFDVDYFDKLRNPSLNHSKSVDNDRLFEVITESGETFRLAEIIAFLPFTDDGNLRQSMQDYLAAALMAIYHFNNPQLSPHITPSELDGCDIKLTAEFFDTQYSPIHSTRLFTDILQRDHTLTLPAPAGVLGAYRSAVTSPLAILTGVNDIPQISYGSTSTDFNVKEQYPLFGRTIHSSTGEALVALELYKSLQATHVGVLFVTDAFGSALQKAFQDAASEASIVTNSVAFSYSADPHGSEIRNAVTSLKNTHFRFFYVIAFEGHYGPIMTAAEEEGLIGDDFFWLFDGLDIAIFHQNAAYEPDSPLAKATHGVGLLTVEGGLRPEIKYPNRDIVPPLSQNPTSSYEKFRTSWRNTIQDPTITSYFRSQMPLSVQERPSFNPNYTFGLESTAYIPFLYDAITGLGLSYCRAARRGAFDGAAVFEEFSNLDFQGATGSVQIHNETGTRDYRTEVFTLMNMQRHDELDDDGNAVFQLVPTNYFQEGWKQVPVEGQVFTYAGGSTETPKSLPDPEMNMNYIGDTGRAIGFTLMGIVVALSLAAFVWLIWLRSERVVRSSQPLFLVMIALGALVMASSIVPLSLEEPVSIDGLNFACMSAPWLYLTGAVIAFASLLAKTRGVHQAYTNPDLDFIHVTSFDIFVTFTLLYMLNLIVMLTWTFISPLEWQRINRDSTDIFDRYVESYGTCSNSEALPFVVAILILNITILIVANWWAYQARNIETEYHESRYIGISMASILQAWCMGIPILIVVWDNPQAKFFVEAGIIFVTALAVLLLIFIPKVLAIRTDRLKAAEQSKRTAYTSYTARSRRGRFADDEEKPKSSPKPAAPVNPAEDSSEGSVTKLQSELSAAEAAAAAFSGKPTLALESQEEGETTPRFDLRSSFVALRRSMIFTEGEQEGIRVMHNPRSMRNLQMGGGREYSRRQLQHLEDLRREGGGSDDDDDDDDDDDYDDGDDDMGDDEHEDESNHQRVSDVGVSDPRQLSQ